MIRIRPYKPADAEIISRYFIDDEELFYKWCAGHYDFPLTANQLNDRYNDFQKESTQFFMTAVDESGNVCGHFIFRNADFELNSIHMGFVVVSPDARGKGIGSQMMRQAVKYASEIFGMKRVTLAVFDNNPQALHCYESAGFKIEGHIENTCEYHGESWSVYNMVWEV